MAAPNADWTRVSTGPVPYSAFLKPIQKSQQDDRDYRLIKLDNGLEVMLVHDAKADKAAASLDVAVGHLYDPDDMPGLAHFCEHLLFMGTEQFPRENEYSEFLAKNNGSSNAFTGTSNTNYYFSVATNALSGALERFAAFFHCPLFAPSCTSRELNAVDSEHKKNHQSDMWRIFQLNKHLSKPGHVWSKFGSGNRESLTQVGRDLLAKGLLEGSGQKGPIGHLKSANGSSAATPLSSRIPSPAPSSSSVSSELEGDGGVVGRETRRRLVEWWSKEYCASRMRLCVIGKESLDELAEMVAKLFSPIANRGRDPLPMINDHPFGPNEKCTLVSTQTIMAFHVCEISFPLPYQPPYWQYQPGHFLAHFVGHEGPGSLHSYLKNKGWITALSAGPQNLARGFAMFKVTLHLTKEGFDNYRAATLAVFKYLALLRSSSFPAWYQREMSIIRGTRFRFAEKRRPEDYAVWLTEHMAWPTPRELIISAPQLVQEWDENEKPISQGEKQVREILQDLRVDQGRAFLMAKAEEHERLRGPLQWEKEPWYGTPYRVEGLDENFVAEAQGPNDIPELFLPGPNEFLPTNLEVEKHEVDQPARRPFLIRHTPLSVLWHKKDDQFWVPKANVVFEVRSPVAGTSARATVLTRLYADLVNDALTEFTYDADLAGLSYNFASQLLGLYITLTGYNDKLHVLAHHVLERARNLQIKPDRLEVMKDQAKRDWENFFLGQPYRLSDYYGRYLMSEKQWTVEEKLAELSSITAKEVEEHVVQMLANINMRILAVGNLRSDEAIQLAEMVENILQAQPISPSEVVERCLIPPDASNYVWPTLVRNPKEPNSSLTYYVHMGSFLKPQLRVTSALLAQILAEPAFNILRTREQLGYIVSCSQWTSSGESELGLRILVQSERGPGYLEGRVDAFLDEMKEKIETMSPEEFAEQKAGLERRWREKAKNLDEEFNRYFTHIDSGYVDFYRRESDANLLNAITQDDVLSLFLSRVHHSSSSRAKISIQLRSQQPRPKKVSREAISAFVNMIADRGFSAANAPWKEVFPDDTEPLFAQFAQYWQDTLAQEDWNVPSDAAKELLESLPALLEQYPAKTESEAVIPDDVSVIQDVAAFKSSLRVSDKPKPLVDWGDLPTANL
ncbi:insulin-degrading enzyme [Obba rivulosa]|uniref:Insulin-degrading enzyme n=1 Tax=Obba rivulosa TaxID=1052685 RepID=A0A8E2DNY5_9APHY|nr:insulin-degrading enzyme [Obba rivulosa]